MAKAKFADQPKRIFAHPHNPVLLGAALLEDAGLIRAADDRMSFNFCHFNTALWAPDWLVHAIAAVTAIITIASIYGH